MNHICITCLLNSGVRVSGFLNEDEKKHQQKSIVHFLEPGKHDTGSRLSPKKSGEEIFPKAPDRESFFNKKRATIQQTNKETSVNESSSKQSPQDVKSATTFIEQAKDNDHQIFVCPVCFKEHRDSSLEAFNRHIDSCLSEATGKDNIEITNGSKLWENTTDLSLESQKNKCQKETSEPHVEIQPTDKVNNSFSNSVNGFPQLKDNEYGNQNRYSSPDDFIFGVPTKQTVSSKLLSVEKEHNEQSSCTENKLPWFSTATETKFLVCPVCNLEQNTKDLALFNKHVDVCLNKGIIKELTESSKSIGEFYQMYRNVFKICFEHLRYRVTKFQEEELIVLSFVKKKMWKIYLGKKLPGSLEKLL